MNTLIFSRVLLSAALLSMSAGNGAEVFEKIEALDESESGDAGKQGEIAPSGNGDSYNSVEEVVMAFGCPGSKLGAFLKVPSLDEGTSENVMVHFSQSREHSATVLFSDSNTAVVSAEGSHYRVGYCAGIFLIDMSGDRDSSSSCKIKDCLRRVGGGYSYFSKVEVVKLPQFAKPLLHFTHYIGGRRVGNYYDEWFRMDRGTFESVLSMRTGKYCQPPYSRSGIGIEQDTEFSVKGERLLATTERTIEPRDKPAGKTAKFSTWFSWSAKDGKFVAKDSRKLEMRDVGE